MTTLVTGASGNVGSEVMEQLAMLRHPARGAYHGAAKAEGARRRGIDAVAVDLDDPTTLVAAMEGVETVLLVTGSGENQLGQELNVVRCAAATGVKRIVKLSVWREPEELSPFARIHRRVELEIQTGPMDWTFLRPSAFMQTFLPRMGPGIRCNRRFAQPAGGPVSYIDTRDISQVAVRELTAPSPSGTVHTLTGPEALTFAELAGILTELIGEPVSYTQLLLEEYRTGLASAGVPGHLADAVLGVASAHRYGGMEATTSTVKELTGRPPRSFREFLLEHIDQLR